MRLASADDRAKIDTQSSERHAATTPLVLNNPNVGLKPMRLLNAAGTRPEPAVSVPSAKLASPSATATAEPLDEPPLMKRGSKAFLQIPYGERVPTNPVVN